MATWPELNQFKARSFFWVYHISAEDQGLEPFSAAFPAVSGEPGQKWSNWDVNYHPERMPTL